MGWRAQLRAIVGGWEPKPNKSVKNVPYLSAKNISTFRNLAKVELSPFLIKLDLPQTEDLLVF